MPFANDCLDATGVCINRLWTLSMSQSAVGEQLIQLIDPLTSQLIDLTQYGIFASSSSSSGVSSSSSSSADDFTGVQVTAKEMYTSIIPLFQVDALIKSDADARNGIIYIDLEAANTRKAGMFIGQAAIYQDGNLKRTIPFWFELTPNLDLYCQPGPISIAEVRYAVRDMCPAANFLIDAVDFSNEEIAWAIRRPIDYWNDALPPIAPMTPSTFPFRYQWLDATIGELLITVAVWMRRNDLDYSAGGLTVADTKKWPDYLKMGQERLAAYKEWVKNRKIAINVSRSFSSLGGYRSNPYR